MKATGMACQASLDMPSLDVLHGTLIERNSMEAKLCQEAEILFDEVKRKFGCCGWRLKESGFSVTTLPRLGCSQ